MLIFEGFGSKGSCYKVIGIVLVFYQFLNS